MTNIRTPNLSRIGALLLGASFISSAALTAVAEDPQLLYTTNGASWTWHVDGLVEDHPVGVYQAGNPSGTGLLLGEVTVPTGTGGRRNSCPMPSQAISW